MSWIFDVIGGLVNIASIPFETIREIAKRVDPDDDVGVQAAARALNVPTDALKAAIRKAREEGDRE